MTTDEAGDGSVRSDENFLSRWSRRKIEARETVAVSATVEPAPPGPAEVPATRDSATAASAAEPLPSVESLHGLEGDYSGFLKPEVDDVLRRSALKKLFADPHFNVIDDNEAYSGDWATFTPVPASALAMMEQVKHLLVDPDEPKTEKEAEAQSTAEDTDDDQVFPADVVDAAQTERADNSPPDGSAADAVPAPQGNA